MLRRSAAELEGELVGAGALGAPLLMASEPFDPYTSPFAYAGRGPDPVPTLVNILVFGHIEVEPSPYEIR